MADEDRPPPEKPGARRRPPAVIDLEATEVAADSASSEQAGAPETTPEPASDPQPKASEQSTGPRQQPSSEASARGSSGSKSRFWVALGAGLAGAVGGIVVLLAVWFAGVRPPGGGDAASDLGPRLAAIEKRLAESAERAAPTGNSKAFDDLAARLSKLEQAVASPRAPVADPMALGRLTAAEAAAKTAAEQVAGLSRRADALDAAVRDTNSRIEKLGATLEEVRNAARHAAAGSDRASRFAIAASALRDAVERGDPFQAELAVVKPLASDADAVAALEPFAASGVPTATALGNELAAVLRAMTPENATGSGGFLERLAAHAEKLVRIRPVGAARGDDRDAILSRAEHHAARGEVDAAMAELMKLSPEARAPAQAWIAKAQARSKAIAASRKLSAAAIASLKAAP